MEPSSTTAKVKSGGLAKRVLSALVILPVTLVPVWLGGEAFLGLLAVLAVLSCLEWATISGESRRWIGVALAVLVLAGTYGLHQYPLPAMIWGGLALFAIGGFLGIRSGRSTALLTGFGAVYMSVAFYAAWYLRVSSDGLATFLWLCAMVVMTDVGAYAAGKTIGGAKLAPKISPNKTWAGLIGGMLASSLAAVCFAAYLEKPLVLFAVVGASVTIVAQMGDLLESSMKRRAGVKDSSHLIPGHGGVLDRLDGFLSASIWLFLLLLYSNGL